LRRLSACRLRSTKLPLMRPNPHKQESGLPDEKHQRGDKSVNLAKKMDQQEHDPSPTPT
jgi:hypothetical protein